VRARVGRLWQRKADRTRLDRAQKGGWLGVPRGGGEGRGPGTVQREGGRGGLADGKTQARQHQVEQHGSRGATRSWRGAYGEMAGGLARGKRKERKNGPGQGNSATF
jgi:hypothetical protein